MSNAPIHAAEHNDLMQLLARLTDTPASKIKAMILITIGTDDRPMVGTDLGDTNMVASVMAQVLSAHDQIAVITPLNIPKGN